MENDRLEGTVGGRGRGRGGWAWQGGGGSGGGFGGGARGTQAADMMDWEPTQAVEIRAVNVKGHPTGPGLPDDHLLRGKRAKWAPQAEVERRRSASACYRCGRVGCRTAVCPLA